MTTANLNLQENAQRKSILNAMFGTRVFRGSALSRAVVGNTPGQGGENAAPAPSSSQQNGGAVFSPTSASLLDARESAASGATPAGGTGASASGAALAAARGQAASAVGRLILP